MSHPNYSSSSKPSEHDKSTPNHKKWITFLLTALILSIVCIAYLVFRVSQFANVQSQNSCPGVCCDRAIYTTITEGSLDSMICNYRNHDWWKTSPLFNQNNSFGYDNWLQLMSERGIKSMYSGDYDARYMDVSREDLENYLCRLRKIGGEKTKFIRLYYIRYGAPCFNPAYVNKHSLAMIPVDEALNEMPNTTYFDPSLSSKSLVFASHIANHNEMCPPEPPRGCSARLNKLDSSKATYY